MSRDIVGTMPSQKVEFFRHRCSHRGPTPPHVLATQYVLQARESTPSDMSRGWRQRIAKVERVWVLVDRFPKGTPHSDQPRGATDPEALTFRARYIIRRYAAKVGMQGSLAMTADLGEALRT